MPKTLPIVFLLIALVIVLFALRYSPVPVPLPGAGSNNSYIQTATPYPTPYTGPRPETVIVNGPKDWEEVSTTPYVIFQYVAIWDGDLRDILFETKVDEIDKDWQQSTANSRVIHLLPGKHVYHFHVRATTKDGISDNTPATRTFWGNISEKTGVKITNAFPRSVPQKLIIFNSGPEIDVSDWTIETSFGSSTITTGLAAGVGSTTVITGVRLFYPHSSIVYQNISLKTGDSLIVVGQKSPSGFNFYLNRCFGYLDADYNFGSLFPKDCPRPSYTEISYFSSACQQFINSLGVCQIPSATDINRFNNDPACQQFLKDYYRYSTCVDRYQSSPDFFKREWYVFAKDQFMNVNHDRIVLRDGDGLVVDAYQY
ncbi:MAG TPA: hypothetical protein PLR11_01990 [Candidatus Paceibacterota bacterium]|nr:hypothetical protein [Candidatus Paceibacterota bacterium]